MRSWHFFPVVVFSAVSLIAAPQTKPPAVPAAGESIDVAIANVDVVVTDKQGRRVTGLTRDDFELFEGKQQKPISNFAEYGAAAGTPARAGVEGVADASPRALPRPQRTLIVFIDDMTLRRDQKPLVFDAIKSFVHRTIGPGDSVLVVTWHSYLDARVGFTDKLDEVDRAIDHVSDEIRVGRGPAANDLRLEQLRLEAAEAEAAVAFGQPLPTADGPDVTAAVAECTSARSYAKMAYFDIRNKLDALASLLSSMSGREGKKILLLASHRLSKVAGAEFFYYACQSTRLNPNVQSEFGTAHLFDPLVQAANANGVTIYPIYAEGIGQTTVDATTGGLNRAPTAVSDSLVLNNETAALDEVARATGGTLAWGAHDVVKFLPQVADELDHYYSLAYRLEGAKGDVAHAITVRTKNRDYIVRARRSYVEKSDETKMRDRVVGALFHRSPPTNIAVTATVGTPTPAEKKRTRFPISIQIPISALTALPQGGKSDGSFSVYVAWGGVFGEISDVAKYTQPFSIPDADLQKARAGHFTYDLDVVADPETNRVAVGVYDEVGKEYGLLRVDIRQPSTTAATNKEPQ